MRRRLSVDDLPVRLREIAAWERRACDKAWREIFGTEPPKRLRPATLRRILAYDQQSRILGGLSASERRALLAIAAGRAPTVVSPAQPSPGTHLVREWNGRTYRVAVTEGGYVFDGTSYASLSAVAKRITGTAWSGPRFFGLTAKRSA